MALLLVLENSGASHYNDACKPVSVCKLLRIENNRVVRLVKGGELGTGDWGGGRAETRSKGGLRRGGGCQADSHAARMARFAMRAAAAAAATAVDPDEPGLGPVAVRIGLHSGPVRGREGEDMYWRDIRGEGGGCASACTRAR